MKSEVYFSKASSADIKERISALDKILEAVKPFASYRRDEFIAVKITLGDGPCIYNLSPELVKTVVSRVKKTQAKPFLFDTSVIYKGRRHNAVDHLILCQDKGFAYNKVGAPFIVADGLFGQDGREHKIDAAHINKIKIPSFIGMIDSLVLLSHATGHVVSKYAGAIKNVAMGMSCRSTKQIQHSALKPSVIANKCTACACCIAICPVAAISMIKGKALIDQKSCIGCGECLCACKFDAITINWHEDPLIFCRRMVEVASYILPKFKNKIYLNFALDITKECDCISTKDEKMVADNLGILASYDILSLDKATADLAREHKKTEYLKENKNIYDTMFEYAQEKGLGNLDYSLVEI